MTSTTDPGQGSCLPLATSLSLDEEVGQLFMVGTDSAGLSSENAGVLRRTHAGSVILLQTSTAGRSAIRSLTDRVRDVASAPKGVQAMLTVDQEGGKVQRLRGTGFDRIPSAVGQARLSDQQLRRAANSWGRQLRLAGVDANLAPVADVVPRGTAAANQPIGALDRGYGPDPQVVAGRDSAFVRGMDQAGVATAVKHFPGLGRVRGNTDFTRHVVDPTTTPHDADLAGFQAGIAAGADMVMVSSAYYARIDPDHRAAFSTTVIESMLRGDLGFSGVIISDDLAARAMEDLSPAQRALRFLNAGGDLAIVGNPALAQAMVNGVLARARADSDFAAQVRRKAARVLAMKATRALAHCG